MARNLLGFVKRRDSLSTISLLPRISSNILSRFQHSLSAPFLDGVCENPSRFSAKDFASTATEQFDSRSPSNSFSCIANSRSSHPAAPGCSYYSGPFSRTHALSSPVLSANEGGATEPTSGEGESVTSKREGVNSKRRLTRTLIEVLRMLPNWGVGAYVAKTHWQPGNFYKVTAVKPKRGKSGDVWGVFHSKGEAGTGKEEKMSGVGKPGWKEVSLESEKPGWILPRSEKNKILSVSDVA